MSGSTGSVVQTRAEPLGDAFDLLAAYGPPMGMLFERHGMGVAGSTGIASGILPFSDLLVLGDVMELLNDIVRHGRDVAPVAMGAIAFPLPRGGPPAVLAVPGRAVRRDGSGTWRIDAVDAQGDPGGSRPFERVAGRAPHEPFTRMQLLELPAGGAYENAVREAVDRIRRGQLRKVVLARTIEVTAERELDPRLLAHRLRAVDPDAYTFAVPTDEGVLVGASPELLVSRRGLDVRSNPLAGSAPRSGDPDEDRANADALVGSAKDREEHAIVVGAVAETLRRFCVELVWDQEPVLRETPNVWHLSTRFRGVLRTPAPTALDLVAALHPTPAVAGEPREAALEAIAELEPFSRGRYAGAVGWVDADGDGEWAIALRCAELRGDRAVLYAGAGIVADSDPGRELDETERKFRAFLDALRWG
ncbi:MAG TPA: isochorismate synthase [Actinomycetota bacterium]|nr:isochorismate synthase [Actinomycetota bacterium]